MELALVLGLVTLATLALVRRARRSLGSGGEVGGCGCGTTKPGCGVPQGSKRAPHAERPEPAASPSVGPAVNRR